MNQLVLALTAVAAVAGCAPAAPAGGDQTPESKQLFESHMANIRAMGKAGKLVLAGPFDAPADDRAAYAGLFVLDVASAAEARALLAGDPATASGRFVPELRTWLGPAGITYDGAGRFTP